MICDVIIPTQSDQWVEDRPFLLWEIGPRRVIDHWMATLFRTNTTMRIWLETPDDRLFFYLSETFPLNRRVQVQSGPPTSRPEACTFLDSKGNIVMRRGPQLSPYLPRQPASRTWFAMVKNWLAELQTAGSQTPELETQVSPGVFIGHHCDISKNTTFVAPCWVGSGSTIHGATIGPHTVIGENCIVCPGASITESYLVTGTFVAPGVKMSGLAVGPSGMVEHATGSHPQLS